MLESYVFSGEPAQIAEIKRLASGAVTPLYRRATNEGIQLFLAGSAGLLQITENIRSEQCPGVTVAGRGAVSPENIAFTRWLTHLQNGVLLDEQNCLMLHELWLQSGTGQRRWKSYRMMSGKLSLCISPQKEVTGVTSGVTRMYRCGGTVCVTTYCRKKPCRLTC
uniref:DUF1281 domain-containing protein n=1 Tax=Escherichia coli TaxID=562 RepID=A0A1L5JRM7_ECOLX|nr:hypothetical protein ATO45_2P0540 [Escherichia coli]